MPLPAVPLRTRNFATRLSMATAETNQTSAIERPPTPKGSIIVRPENERIFVPCEERSAGWIPPGLLSGKLTLELPSEGSDYYES